jgi:hypothetical protein
MGLKHNVRGSLFCNSCLCCVLFVRISLACCGDMVVGIGVWLALIFVCVACSSVRTMLLLSNSCNDRV